MIKVTIKQEKFVNEISIKGHALYNDFGKDIVCAAVSSIVICTINGILSIDKEAIDINDKNGIIINVKKENEVVDKLLLNMINLLEELETKYKNNIKIIK